MEVSEQKIELEHKRASIHSFAPYLATFPDEIPKYVIEKFLPPATLKKNCGGKKLILDPFCGSGTTLVVAAENNVKAIGVDFNPVAVLISNSKCSRFIEGDYIDAEKLIKSINACEAFTGGKNIDLSVNLEKIRYWFHSKVAEDLFRLRDILLKCKNEKVKTLALVVYAVTLRSCSYAQNDTASRARKTFAIIEASSINAFKDFTKRFEKALELKKKQTLVVADNMAFEGDSRKLVFDDELFDCIVTSPPYIANLSYSTPFDLFYVFMNQKVEKKGFINGTDKNKFFEGMTQAYKEMFRLLKKNAPCIMVVGERETEGTIQYMEEAGFKLEEKLFYNIKGGCRGFFHGIKKNKGIRSSIQETLEKEGGSSNP